MKWLNMELFDRLKGSTVMDRSKRSKALKHAKAVEGHGAIFAACRGATEDGRLLRLQLDQPRRPIRPRRDERRPRFSRARRREHKVACAPVKARDGAQRELVRVCPALGHETRKRAEAGCYLYGGVRCVRWLSGCCLV